MCNTNSNTKSGLVSLIRLEERIFHTITISAVTSFTKNGLPYTQSSIFNDEMNRKELFLEESIDYSVSELVNYSKSKNLEKKDKNEFKSDKNDNYDKIFHLGVIPKKSQTSIFVMTRIIFYLFTIVNSTFNY